MPVPLAIGGRSRASVWSTLTHGSEVYFDSGMHVRVLPADQPLPRNGARHRAGEAAEELVKLLPATANRLTDDGEVVAVSGSWRRATA